MSVTCRPRIWFSLRDLVLLITGICVWLAVIRYLGPLGLILSSPLLGGWFMAVGSVFRLRSVALLGMVIFFTGPLMLGLVYAWMDVEKIW